MFPVYASVNTPLSQNNSFNLSIHLADVFSNPTTKSAALAIDKAHADAGKTPTVVVLAINPPMVPANIGYSVAGF